MPVNEVINMEKVEGQSGLDFAEKFIEGWALPEVFSRENLEVLANNYPKAMVQAKVIVHDTFKHYLDAANFPDGNPEADPEQEKVQVYYIDSKSTETNEIVEFTLSSPADLQGLLIPTRQIHSLCTWCMRGDYRSGNGCDYAGTLYFDEKGNPTDDPSKDKCSGLLVDCKKRFGADNPLPFGGFPGAALIKR